MAGLLEFAARFGAEEQCIEHLAGLRWPGGFVCGGCGGRQAWRLKARPRVYECTACHRQESVTGRQLNEISCRQYSATGQCLVDQLADGLDDPAPCCLAVVIAGSAVYDACMNLRAALLQKAGLNRDNAAFADGVVSADGQTVRLDGLVGDGLSADGAATPGNSREAFIQQSYGAHFAEVGVSEVTGEIRLRRMNAVYNATSIRIRDYLPFLFDRVKKLVLFRAFSIVCGPALSARIAR